MGDNIQTNTTGRLTPCLQKKTDKTTYLVEVHFSYTSIQSVEDKLKRVILHDLEHGKQGKIGKFDEYVLGKLQPAPFSEISYRVSRKAEKWKYMRVLFPCREIRHRTMVRPGASIGFRIPMTAGKATVWKWIFRQRLFRRPDRMPKIPKRKRRHNNIYVSVTA